MMRSAASSLPYTLSKGAVAPKAGAEAMITPNDFHTSERRLLQSVESGEPCNFTQTNDRFIRAEMLRDLLIGRYLTPESDIRLDLKSASIQGSLQLVGSEVRFSSVTMDDCGIMDGICCDGASFAGEF